MDEVDGELVPNIQARNKLIKLIRELRPDVIISPRPHDYHPDHRATGILVQDCSFLVGVPAVCPETPRLEKIPFIFYHQDIFTKPYPFMPEVITDVTSVIDKKMESLGLHESQVFEWLPFIYPITDPIPESKSERIEFCKRNWGNRGGALRFLPLLDDPSARFAEALERCEYGAKVTEEIALELFPFAKLNFGAAEFRR